MTDAPSNVCVRFSGIEILKGNLRLGIYIGLPMYGFRVSFDDGKLAYILVSPLESPMRFSPQ